MVLFAILGGIVLWFLLFCDFSVKQLEYVASYIGLSNISIYREIDVKFIETRTRGSKSFICTKYATTCILGIWYSYVLS